MNTSTTLQTVIIFCLYIPLSSKFQSDSPEYWNYIKEYAKCLKAQEQRARDWQSKETYDLSLPDAIIAVEEKGDLFSEIESGYAKSHSVYGEFLDIKPLMDKITTKEKHLSAESAGINRIVVDMYENFSKALNNAIEIPANALKEVWKKWLRYFDILGSKIFQLDHKLEI